MGYTEFLDWLEFLNWNEKRETKLDHYLAQIAAEINKGMVKDPKKVKREHFLLKVVEAPNKQKERMQHSKSVWLAALNIRRPEVN